MHQVSLASTQGDIWCQIESEIKTMPIELGVDSKHKLSWNIASYYGLNILWFHIELLKTNDATPQRHPQWLFFIRNLVVNFRRRKIMRIKANLMKKIIFFELWKSITITILDQRFQVYNHISKFYRFITKNE